MASVTAEALIPFTSVPSVNKLILQHLHLIWIVSVQFEIQNLLVSELPHFFLFLSTLRRNYPDKFLQGLRLPGHNIL